MATRLYLPISGTAPLSALAVDANWELTTGLVRRPCFPTKQNTALTTDARTWPATTTQQWAWIQYQSDPLAAAHSWTTADTVSMVIGKCGEPAAATADTHLAYVVRVVSGDGASIRGVIGLYHATSTEFPDVASAATRIHSARVNGAANFSSQIGDRIIIEIGLHGVTPAAVSVQMRFGDPSGTADFALTAALTTDLDPWVELSRTVTFLIPSGSGTPALTLGATGVGQSISYGFAVAALTLGLVGVGEAPIQPEGFVVAALTLSASGAGTHVATGDGASALTLGATGEGTQAPAGDGTAALTLAAAGTGVALHAGDGSSILSLGVSGAGVTVVSGDGTAALTLSAEGVGEAPSVTIPEGFGVVALSLGAAGEGAAIHVGTGAAALTLHAEGEGSAPAMIPSGAGTVVLSLQAVGAGETAHQGTGIAALVLAATGRGLTTGKLEPRRRLRKAGVLGIPATRLVRRTRKKQVIP